MDVCVRVYVSIYKNTHIYTYTYMYIYYTSYIHTHIHIYMYMAYDKNRAPTSTLSEASVLPK